MSEEKVTTKKKSETNYFATLAARDVGNYVEKKGQFSYLSWTWAIQELRTFDPTATWEVHKFTHPNGAVLPYMLGPNGAFTEVSVTVKGITLSQIQPVMDFKNKSVANPDAMEVNKAIQRCLVKAIALHGLGLYIYSGEDLPVAPEQYASDDQVTELEELAEEFAALRNSTVDQVYGALKIRNPQGLPASQISVLTETVKRWIEQAKAKAQEAAAATTA